MVVHMNGQNTVFSLKTCYINAPCENTDSFLLYYLNG